MKSIQQELDRLGDDVTHLQEPEVSLHLHAKFDGEGSEALGDQHDASDLPHVTPQGG